MFKHEPWLDHLEDLDLFAGCSRPELKRIAPLCTQVRFSPGAVLIREGEIGSEFIVIAEGTAEVRLGGVDGAAVATLGAGDFAGEIALLDGSRRTASVVAVTPLVAYVLNRSEFSSLLRAAPDVAARIEAARDRRAGRLPVAA